MKDYLWLAISVGVPFTCFSPSATIQLLRHLLCLVFVAYSNCKQYSLPVSGLLAVRRGIYSLLMLRCQLSMLGISCTWQVKSARSNIDKKKCIATYLPNREASSTFRSSNAFSGNIHPFSNPSLAIPIYLIRPANGSRSLALTHALPAIL